MTELTVTQQRILTQLSAGRALSRCALGNPNVSALTGLLRLKLIARVVTPAGGWRRRSVTRYRKVNGA